MLKYSQSIIHSFNNITFFCGLNKSKNNSDYMFEESMALFSKENLACHLFEYEEADLLKLDFKNNSIINEVVTSFKVQNSQKFNVFDVRIDNIGPSLDVQFKYHKKYLSTEDVEIFKSILEEETQFNISFVEIEDLKEYRVSNVDPDKFTMLKIVISDKFIQKRKDTLSESFLKSFNPNRYVDTQILFFFIMVSLISYKS